MLDQSGSPGQPGSGASAATRSVSAAASGFTSLRWLVVPGLLMLFALVGLAVASNDPTEASTQPDGQVEPVELPPVEDPDETGESSESDSEGSPEVTVNSPEGEVSVRFDSDGVVQARSTGTDGAEVELAAGDNGSYEISQGGLAPVPPGRNAEDAQGGGVVLAPGDDFGVVVVTPEGDSVRLQADGEAGGVSAVDLNEGAAPLTPNEQGLVVLDDGTTIGPLQTPVEVAAGATDSPMPWRVIFITIAVVAAVSAATGLFLHRNSEEAPIVMGRSPGSRIRTVPFAELMERMAADPDPTRAIRIGFDAAQAGLGGLPSRSVDETPFEWEARVSETRPEVSGPVQALCDLFARARFAPGAADENDRAAMMEQLRIIHEQRRPATGTWALETTGG